MQVLIESLSAIWDRVVALTLIVEERSEANLATPCPMNVSNLLYCAVAAAQSGDHREADRLEEIAESVGMTGYGTQLDPPRMMLALVRRDLDTLRRLVEGLDEAPLIVDYPQSRAPFFDALLALREYERIETEAPVWIKQNSYVSPFALRALGLVREDAALIEEAARTFEAMGLTWHAERTRERRTTA